MKPINTKHLNHNCTQEKCYPPHNIEKPIICNLCKTNPISERLKKAKLHYCEDCFPHVQQVLKSIKEAMDTKETSEIINNKHMKTNTKNAIIQFIIATIILTTGTLGFLILRTTPNWWLFCLFTIPCTTLITYLGIKTLRNYK